MENNSFTNFLVTKGFKIISGTHPQYSSMVNDGIQTIFEKDGVLFYWGLSEAGKPPTLISPRPELYRTFSYMGNNGIRTVEFTDDLMNECLLKFTNEEIYDGIFNGWKFIVDTKKIIKE